MFGWFQPAPDRGRSSTTTPRSNRANVQIEVLESRNLLSVFTPAQIRHAYGFDQIAFNVNGRSLAGDGSGQTIAIINAYDHPNIHSDLRFFDRAFGLPDPPTFTKATPQGMPKSDPLWALETALDVEWAHAIAPGANILLVEAKSNNSKDLLGAVDYARQQPGVVVISMSWGSPEFASETSFDTYFTTPAGHYGGSTGLPGSSKLPGGITFFASTGDNGAKPGAQWPAVSPHVVAVGGTSLKVLSSGGTYQGEAGWSGSGGGTSTYFGTPSYQSAFQSSGKRSIPDVSYNADPNAGFYVYTSVAYNGHSGWLSVAGTSAAAPQWAALIAIADQGRALAGKGSLDGTNQTLPAIYQFSNRAFHDVTSGSNGFAATTGYDLVTGRGSPYASIMVVQGFLSLPSWRPAGFASGSSNPSTQKLTPALTSPPHSSTPRELLTTTNSFMNPIPRSALISTASNQSSSTPASSSRGYLAQAPFILADKHDRQGVITVAPRLSTPSVLPPISQAWPANPGSSLDRKDDLALPLVEEGDDTHDNNSHEMLPQEEGGSGKQSTAPRVFPGETSGSDAMGRDAIDTLFAERFCNSPPALKGLMPTIIGEQEPFAFLPQAILLAASAMTGLTHVSGSRSAVEDKPRRR